MLNLALLALLILPSDSVSFRGYQVTVIDPGLADKEGHYPKGEAKVCVLGQPPESCYTAPTGVGRSPTLTLIELRQGQSALFFQASGGGVSGFSQHFALFDLCDPARHADCKPAELRNLFPADLEVSNVSQFSWWNLPAISPSKLFLTADFVWGPLEGHSADHRFIISVYARRPDNSGDQGYTLVDRFKTVHSYGLAPGGGLADVLGAERKQILTRLKKVKATWPPERRDREPR